MLSRLKLNLTLIGISKTMKWAILVCKKTIFYNSIN